MSKRLTITEVAELIGIRIVPFLPGTALLLWGVGLYWTIAQILKRVGLEFPRAFRLCLVSLILLITLRSQSYLFQVLFWQTGILTYVLPILCWVFTLGWFLNRFQRQDSNSLKVSEGFLFFLWAFILGGISETSLFLQISVFGLLIVYTFIRIETPHRWAVLTLLAAGLLGSLAALGVVAGSPGNAVRSPGFPPKLDFLELIVGSLRTTGAFLKQWVRYDSRMLLTAFGFSALLALGYPLNGLKAVPGLKIVKILIFATLMAFSTVWITFVPAYYILQAWPPDRALIMAQFILSVWAVFAGYWTVVFIHRWFEPVFRQRAFQISSLSVLVLLLLLGPVHAALNLATLVPKLSNYAARWDARDALIRSEVTKGRLELEVPILPDFSKLGDVRPERDFWINQDVARYYGLNSITAQDNPADPP